MALKYTWPAIAASWKAPPSPKSGWLLLEKDLEHVPGQWQDGDNWDICNVHHESQECYIHKRSSCLQATKGRSQSPLESQPEESWSTTLANSPNKLQTSPQPSYTGTAYSASSRPNTYASTFPMSISQQPLMGTNKWKCPLHSSHLGSSNNTTSAAKLSIVSYAYRWEKLFGGSHKLAFWLTNCSTNALPRMIIMNAKILQLQAYGNTRQDQFLSP